MTRISREKEDLVRRLRLLMDVERSGIEVELAGRIEELENMKKRHREEETKLQLEITSLSEKLDSLVSLPPVLNSIQRYTYSHILDIVISKRQLYIYIYKDIYIFLINCFKFLGTKVSAPTWKRI